MLDLLLTEEIKKYLRYHDVHDFSIDDDKIRMAVKKLTRYATVVGHAPRHMIFAYSYFYVQVYREMNFNKIYLKVTEFLDNYESDLDVRIISDEDVQDAMSIENTWLNMNRFDVNTLPMQVRKVLSKNNVTIGMATTYKYSRNYLCYAKIANWIRENHHDFPQIHGYGEFFIHLPAVNGNAEFYPEDFFNVGRTLDRYYKLVYGDTPKKDRFNVFFETLHPSLKTAEALRKSTLFAAPDILQRLQKESVGV
jgi:hypothetical protein